MSEISYLDRDKYNQGDQYAQNQRLLPVADAKVQDFGKKTTCVLSLQNKHSRLSCRHVNTEVCHCHHVSCTTLQATCVRWQSDMNLTGSFLLHSALIELGEGKSSSEKRLGLRFLASSIGSSSSCSSGSLSANEGEVRVLKLVLCLSMLVIGYYERKTLHVRLVPECMLSDFSVLQHALVCDVACAAGRKS